MTTTNRRFHNGTKTGALLLFLGLWFLFFSFFCWSSYSLFDLITIKLTSHELPHRVLINNDTLAAMEPLAQVRYLMDKSPDLSARNLSDAFIQRFLVSRDDDAIETIELIGNYFRVRKEHPEFFMNATQAYENFQPPLFYYQTETTPSGSPIMYMKLGNWNYSSHDYTLAMASAVPFSELAALEGRNKQAATTLLDMRDWTWSHFLAVRPQAMKMGFELIEKVLPIKQGGPMHILFQGWVVDMFFSVGKGFMTEQQQKALVFHGNNLNSLYKLIPRERLPKVLGGETDLRTFSKEELEVMDKRLEKYWAENPVD